MLEPHYLHPITSALYQNEKMFTIYTSESIILWLKYQCLVITSFWWVQYHTLSEGHRQANWCTVWSGDERRLIIFWFWYIECFSFSAEEGSLLLPSLYKMTSACNNPVIFYSWWMVNNIHKYISVLEFTVYPV